MSSSIVVDLFAEDWAHEALLAPMILRAGNETGVSVRVRTRSARGGHGRAIAEYVEYQRLLQAGVVDPDIIVVAIDGNCSTFTKKRQEIEEKTDPENRTRVVPACPDPHIERWFLADPDSFQVVVGSRPRVGRKKCVRDHYKQMLATAVQQGGHPATLGGLEFARDLVEKMDFYRAGKNDASLRAFLDDLKNKLKLRRAAAPDRTDEKGT